MVAGPCVGGGPVRRAFAFFTRCGLFLRSALLPNVVTNRAEYFTLLIEEAIL